MERPKGKKEVPCRELSIAEINLMKDSFDGAYAKRNRTLFMLGLFTGYRIAELLSLRLADVCNITIQDKTINAQVFERVTVASKYMKGKKSARSVILSDMARALLYDYIYDWPLIYSYYPSTHKKLEKVRLTQKELDTITRKNKVIELQNQVNALLGKKEKPLFPVQETKLQEFSMFLFPSRSGRRNVTRLENGEVNMSDRYTQLSTRQASREYLRTYQKCGFANVGNGSLATHSTRKTFCYELQKVHGNDLVTISRSMGHATVNSTMSYMKNNNLQIDTGILKLYNEMKLQEEEKKELNELVMTLPDYT